MKPMSEVKDFFLAEESQDRCEFDDQALLWQTSAQQLALVCVLFFSCKNNQLMSGSKTNYMDSLEGARYGDNEGMDSKTEAGRSLKVEMYLMCRKPELRSTLDSFRHSTVNLKCAIKMRDFDERKNLLLNTHQFYDTSIFPHLSFCNE
jgi:hypothetical protein